MMKWLSIVLIVSLAGCTVAENSKNKNKAEETVLALYDAFAQGQVSAIADLMADDIVWNEAENFPFADGNPYVGFDAIMSGVFGRVAAGWSRWDVRKERVFSTDTMVVVQGYYEITHAETGEENEIQVAHIWTVNDGKITAFQQYADTLKMHRASTPKAAE